MKGQILRRSSIDVGADIEEIEREEGAEMEEEIWREGMNQSLADTKFQLLRAIINTP